MKITIDIEAKEIEVHGMVNIEEFIDHIKELIGESWKEYKLKETIQTNWTPWVYPTYPSFPYDHTPTYEPPYRITCSTGYTFQN